MARVIKIENLSKRYRVKAQLGYINLKEVLAQQLLNVIRLHRAAAKKEFFWALRDINLEIHSGELIGLVGINGSGKSTLLKLMAEVTKPTTGTIHLWGRIGSLLEVGTGFHPELTGRENIYLSGSILGLSWKEVTRRFDEIVAFSEVEKFLDVQVKRYSSGMYMRLAFSVAAHLDPDILLIDEALSVGDMNFRRKCLNKMRSFTQKGATVIFVTHNMSLVSDSCNRCLLLDKGQLVADGPSNFVIQKYLQTTTSPTVVTFAPNETSQGAVVLRGFILNREQPALQAQPLILSVQLEAKEFCSNLAVGFGLCTLDGTRLLSCEVDTRKGFLSFPKPGLYTAELKIPSLPLSPGLYLLDLYLRDEQNEIIEHRPSCAQVEVQPEKGGILYSHFDSGGVRHYCNWELRPGSFKPGMDGTYRKH